MLLQWIENRILFICQCNFREMALSQTIIIFYHQQIEFLLILLLFLLLLTLNINTTSLQKTFEFSLSTLVHHYKNPSNSSNRILFFYSLSRSGDDVINRSNLEKITSSFYYRIFTTNPNPNTIKAREFFWVTLNIYITPSNLRIVYYSCESIGRWRYQSLEPRENHVIFLLSNLYY